MEILFIAISGFLLDCLFCYAIGSGIARMSGQGNEN